MNYIKSNYCNKVRCQDCRRYYPKGLIKLVPGEYHGPQPDEGYCPHGHPIKDLRHDFQCPCREDEEFEISKALEVWRQNNPSPEGQYAIIDPYEIGAFVKARKHTVQAGLMPREESTFFLGNIEEYFGDYIEQIWDINPEDSSIRIKVIRKNHLDDYIIRPLTPDEYIVYLMDKHSIVKKDRQYTYIMDDYFGAFRNAPEEYRKDHAFPEYSMNDIAFVENTYDVFGTAWSSCALVPIAGIDYEGNPLHMKIYSDESVDNLKKTIKYCVVDLFNTIAANNA